MTSKHRRRDQRRQQKFKFMKLFPLGENALTADFGSEISVELNTEVLRLAAVFEQKTFPGFTEAVPAYASLTVFYDAFEVRRNFPEFASAFDAVKDFVQKALENLAEIPQTEPRAVEIPVSFEPECAPDLEFVAAHNDLTPEKVIEIFLARQYRVFMLGFLPGFSYMGEVDARIAAPRRQTPRVRVEKGSVGIAGRQTGIYSLASPGGWQIIGRTPREMFTPEAAAPTFLRAGDAVRFYKI